MGEAKNRLLNGGSAPTKPETSFVEKPAYAKELPTTSQEQEAYASAKNAMNELVVKYPDVGAEAWVGILSQLAGAVICENCPPPTWGARLKDVVANAQAVLSGQVPRTN